MRIDRLHLENFRGFDAFDIELHPQCTLLVGVNGSGKTSVLDGLCVALGAWFLGFPDVAPRSIEAGEVRHVQIETEQYQIDLEPQYPVRVEARGVVAQREVTWARELRSARGRTTYGEAKALKALAEQHQAAVSAGEPASLPVLAYYGTGRLWMQKQASAMKEQGLTSRVLGYQDCLDPASNHKLFMAWMRRRTLIRVQSAVREGGLAAFAKPDPAFEAISAAAAGCLDDVSDVFYDIRREDILITFDGDREVLFSHLSDGYRNLIALAADIAWRALRLNPHDAENMPEGIRGVVLIDEVALHLHPGWQREVLPSLRRTFPNVQFIVSTHSPQVLASVEPECVRFLREGEAPRTPGISRGLDSNTILRDLMGVSPRPPEFEEKIRALEKSIEARQFEDAARQLEALAGVLGQDDPTITGLRWELAYAQESEESA